MAAGFFDNTTGGSFSHNHTAVAGDGGVLVNPAFTGVATETGTPALPTDIATIAATIAEAAAFF